MLTPSWPDVQPLPTPLSRASRWILARLGWRVTGALPATVCGPAVLVAAPHTHNVDLLFGLLGTRALGVAPHFLAKAQLLKFPLGLLMRPLGALPVDRTRNAHTGERPSVTDQSVALLRRGLWVAALPKGQRRGTGPWRNGVRHMSQLSGAPMYLMTMDYGAREIRVHGPHHSGTPEQDQAFFSAALGQATGAVPEWTDVPIFDAPRRA